MGIRRKRQEGRLIAWGSKRKWSGGERKDREEGLPS